MQIIEHGVIGCDPPAREGVGAPDGSTAGVQGIICPGGDDHGLRKADSAGERRPTPRLRVVTTAIARSAALRQEHEGISGSPRRRGATASPYARLTRLGGFRPTIRIIRFGLTRSDAAPNSYSGTHTSQGTPRPGGSTKWPAALPEGGPLPAPSHNVVGSTSSERRARQSGCNCRHPARSDR